MKQDKLLEMFFNHDIWQEMIDKANEKGAGLEYTLDNKELLKSIYRSCF